MDRVENTNKCHYKFINCKTGKVVWEGDSPVLTQELAPYSIYGAVDKYDALIRRKFLEMHRKMWNWIADESERRRRCIGKRDAFAHFHLADHGCHWCMACIYGKWKVKYKDLNKYKCREFCMLDWGKDEETGKKLGCINPGHPYQFSLYEQWLLYVDEYDWVHAAQIAREIANLPERKE